MQLQEKYVITCQICSLPSNWKGFTGKGWCWKMSAFEHEESKCRRERVARMRELKIELSVVVSEQ